MFHANFVSHKACLKVFRKSDLISLLQACLNFEKRPYGRKSLIQSFIPSFICSFIREINLFIHSVLNHLLMHDTFLVKNDLLDTSAYNLYFFYILFYTTSDFDIRFTWVKL